MPPETTQPADDGVMVAAEKLRRTYGPIVACDDISFEARRGDVLGILGPNGAGKSTAMKMLTCFLEPDSGTARVCGHDIRTDPVAVRERVGYLAENSPLYDEMTVTGFLGFVADARGLSGEARRKALDRAVDLTAIASVVHTTIATLSKGFRRRVGLAQALLADPDVLILDEPTDGLDPNQKHEVRELIRRMAPEKCTLVSTHILEEVEAICNRVVIMANGRIRVDSTPAALKEKHGAELDEVFRKITRPAGAKAAAGTR